MSESLGELKAIRDGAPFGCKLYDTDMCLEVSCFTTALGEVRYLSNKSGNWFMYDRMLNCFIEMDCIVTPVRSLSDINRIIELEEYAMRLEKRLGVE